MRIEVEKRRFTVDEYHRMCEIGVIGFEERTELIDGEIIKMTSPSTRHVACTNRATAYFAEAFGRRRAIVSIQNPLLLNLYNEPQSDVVVLKPTPDFYKNTGLTPEHAFLVVEISESSLAFDRKIKLPRYAACGIPEVWIEDLRHDIILVFRDLKIDTYETCLTLHRGQFVSPIAFPDVQFKVDDLLG
jgi:Uma2 family endonuclease